MSRFLVLVACLVSLVGLTTCVLAAHTEEAPPVIGFIDGHADTITAAMDNGKEMYTNDLHIDFERLMEFGAPVQIFTIWCADEYVENAFEYANAAIDFFMEELEKHSDIISLALSFEDIENNVRENKISAILAFEGGEPLKGSMENLEYFYERGLRVMTLTWNRENELGYGAGTESDKGLKAFGIDCVKRMNELGMIIDISHLNEAGFWDVDEISSMPYIASHSNAYGAAAHRRNLKDWQIEAMVERGCIIGLNMYPYFLTGNEKADINDIFRHLEYFIEVGAKDIIGLGCDFDGIEVVPDGLEDVSKLKDLNEAITERFGRDMADAVFYQNFYKFLSEVFKQPVLDILS